MTTGTAHIYKKDFIPLAEAILNSSEPGTLFDDIQNKRLSKDIKYEINSLREVLIAAIGECLNHEEYKISANAAFILRQNMILCSRACDLNDIVSALTDQIDDHRIQPAKEAAISLGHFLSTRPNDRDLPQWSGSDPMTSSTELNDLDQHRFGSGIVDSGYLHKVSPEIIESAISSLISNLNRKEYKRSSNWVVAKECSKALGAIGYQRPEIVSDAVPVIQNLLKEQDERQATLVYALTSIGYSRPDLVGDDLSTRLEEFAENAGTGTDWKLDHAARVGYRKIGHAPIHLEKQGCDKGTDLSIVVNKLFNFMLGRFPSAPEDCTQAFVEIYLARPEELVDILGDEIELILKGTPRAVDFPDNFVLLLKELAGVDADGLEPILERTEGFYEDRGRSHYWFENALEFHRRIATENEDLLPDTIGDTVREFLESERRRSVNINGRAFLKEIDKWDEDLFSKPRRTEMETSDIISALKGIGDEEEELD